MENLLVEYDSLWKSLKSGAKYQESIYRTVYDDYYDTEYYYEDETKYGTGSKLITHEEQHSGSVAWGILSFGIASIATSTSSRYFYHTVSGYQDVDLYDWDITCINEDCRDYSKWVKKRSSDELEIYSWIEYACARAGNAWAKYRVNYKFTYKENVQKSRQVKKQRSRTVIEQVTMVRQPKSDEHYQKIALRQLNNKYHGSYNNFNVLLNI